MSRAAWIALAILCLVGAGWLVLRQTGPEADSIPKSLVDDAAKLMTPAQRASVAEYHDYLLKDHGIDYRVATAAGIGDINLYAVRRFEAMAADSRSRSGRALLLIVDPAQDLVHLAVSYALEGVFPDAFVAYVEQRQMVPFFRDNRVADGILATTELIITRAQRAAANAGFEGEVWNPGSGGAGATAKARIGAGTEPPVPGSTQTHAAGRSPVATLKAYMAAMQNRNRNPDLDLYTPASRTMLRRWTMTPAQMDNVVRAYRNCHAESAKTGPDARRAVIRYPIRERACAPWFFQRDGSSWRLDLTMMQSAIRFGRSNAWHFDMSAKHDYGFAFEDWNFDRNGFPASKR